jgi:hypothetical protein
MLPSSKITEEGAPSAHIRVVLCSSVCGCCIGTRQACKGSTPVRRRGKRMPSQLGIGFEAIYVMRVDRDAKYL